MRQINQLSMAARATFCGWYGLFDFLRFHQNSLFVLRKGGGFENALHDSDLFNGAQCAPYLAAGTSEDL